jgi:hypothetical protein
VKSFPVVVGLPLLESVSVLLTVWFWSVLTLVVVAESVAVPLVV